jgi:hypothetical protein
VRAVRYRWRAARSSRARPSAIRRQTLVGAQLCSLVHCMRPCSARSADVCAPARCTFAGMPVG